MVLQNQTKNDMKSVKHTKNVEVVGIENCSHMVMARNHSVHKLEIQDY